MLEFILTKRKIILQNYYAFKLSCIQYSKWTIFKNWIVWEFFPRAVYPCGSICCLPNKALFSSGLLLSEGNPNLESLGLKCWWVGGCVCIFSTCCCIWNLVSQNGLLKGQPCRRGEKRLFPFIILGKLGVQEVKEWSKEKNWFKALCLCSHLTGFSAISISILNAAYEIWKRILLTEKSFLYMWVHILLPQSCVTHWLEDPGVHMKCGTEWLVGTHQVPRMVGGDTHGCLGLSYDTCPAGCVTFSRIFEYCYPSVAIPFFILSHVNGYHRYPSLPSVIAFSPSYHLGLAKI